MKEYNRSTRKWEREAEPVRKTVKRKLCKGGKEHDWMLCLPSYVRHEDSLLGFEVAHEYYKIKDAQEDAEVAFEEKLEGLGIRSMTFSINRLFGRRRSYICTVCQKRK